MADQKTHVIWALVLGVAYWALFAPEISLFAGVLLVAGIVLGSANGECRGEGFSLSPDLDKYVEKNTKFLGHRSWLLHSPIMPIVLIQAVNVFFGPVETSNSLFLALVWGIVFGWLLHVIIDMEYPEEWREGKEVGWISGGTSLALLVYLLFVNPFWLTGLL